ncbi:hypothetical protein [Cerasicoccus frondis]|uniref:hypothetical protein n=1 Tax=Cerasicoccus frondis TaxID=490090 RepID=UPI002852AC33|nr:hypothetical protein [Cerasicoccus frondis]
MKLSNSKPGFALVVAIMLMGFIVLLLVTVSTLVQTELQLTSTKQSMEEARNNARFGLLMALGRLQSATGPDQRATARADIMSQTLPENRYWTGVWKTIDETNPSQGLEALRAWSTASGQVDWLVSSMTSPTPTQQLTDTVPLVNFIDRETAAEQSVEAGRVSILQDDVSRGHYAWWVGDEGIKAKFNLPASYEEGNSAAESWLLAQAAIQAPHQLGMEAFSGLPDLFDYSALSSSELRSVSNAENLNFLAEGVDSDILDTFRKESFHDMTFYSYGVLSNQRNGGLKKDLSRGLDDQFPEKLAGRPLWWLPEPVTGKVIKGELWDVLYDYANLYRDYPAWQFSGSVNNSGYDYSYVHHAQTGPRGISDPGDPTAAMPLRFFGPESTNGQGSFNRLGKQMGTSSYYVNQVINQYQDSHWSVNESTPKSGRPVWNAVNPVVLGCLWRVGLGSIDLLNYSQSSDFSSDGEHSGDYYDQLQYDRTANEIIYDNPNGGGYGDHPLDLPADWEGRPATGPNAVQGTPRKYYRMFFALQPVVVLWNPYSTPLEVNGLKIVSNFEPWVSIDFNDGTGSGVKPVKVQKYMNYTSGGSTQKFWVVEDNPHAILPSSADVGPKSNNASEQDDRFLLADDALMAGAEFSAGIEINDVVLAPGQIQVFSANSNHQLVANADIPMVAGVNTDAVVMRRTPLKHDFPAGTRINSVQLFYDPENVPNSNEVDGRQNSMKLDIRYQDQNWAPGTRTSASLAQLDQFAPNAASSGDWAEKHEFDVGVNIDDMTVPTGSNGVNFSEWFSNVEWFAVIGAQTKDIDETEGGVPLFSQFNVTRVAERENPSDLEMSGLLWRNKFYSDPEFLDAVESSEIPFWDGGSDVWNDVDNIVLKDIPRQPLSSLTQLMSAGISVNDWDPLYAVGSSYAPPLVAPDQVINRFNQTVGENGVGASAALAMDISFLSNERLYDDFFFSTVPPQNSDSSRPGYSSTYDSSEVPPFRDFTADDIEAETSLPNPRMKVLQDKGDIDYETKLDQLRDYDGAASLLLVDGAFNVNSTSVEAWKTVLSSLRNQSVPSSTGEVNGAGQVGQTPFPRVATSVGDDELTVENLFSGHASLDDEQIQALAEAVVEEVKLRGPFLSLSDFVNRRLEDSDLGYKGALQAALDRTVNADNVRYGESVSLGDADHADSSFWLNDRQGNRLLRTEQLAPKQGAGLPQWILQNDILKSLAPVMQARSDTFLIRAYGDTTNLAGETISRAWCEAVVQRLPEYVDARANPDPTVEPWLVTVNPSGERLDVLTANKASSADDASADTLSDANFSVGRRYRIVSFRWLNESEI